MVAPKYLQRLFVRGRLFLHLSSAPLLNPNPGNPNIRVGTFCFT